MGESRPSEQQQVHLLDVGASSTCSKMQFTSLQPSLPSLEVCAWLWKTPNHIGQCSAKAFPSKESLLSCFPESHVLAPALGDEPCLGRGKRCILPELRGITPVTHPTSPIFSLDQQYSFNRQGQGEYYQPACSVVGWLSLTWLSLSHSVLLCKGCLDYFFPSHPACFCLFASNL